MRYAPDHKAATRRRLVEETAEVIRRDGVQAVGVASIMSRAGLTHGGFYAHFASRDELVAAGLAQLFADGQTLFRSQGGELPPAEAVVRYIDAYLSRAHRDFAGAACPLPILSAEAPRLPGPERDRYAAGAAGLRRLLAHLLEKLGRDDPEALASSAVAELVGAVTLARAEPDAAASDAILARSRAQLKRRLGVETTA